MNKHKRDRLLRNAELCWRTAAISSYPASWTQRMWLSLLFWAQADEGDAL